MQNDPDWFIILVAALAVGVSAIAWRQRKSVAKKSKAPQSVRVEYDFERKVFASIGGLVTVGLFVLLLFADAERIIPILIAILITASFAVPLFMEYFLRNLTWDDTWVYYRSPWSGKKQIRLIELSEPHYSSFRMVWIIPTMSQGKIILSHNMLGVNQFLEHVEKHRK